LNIQNRETEAALEEALASDIAAVPGIFAALLAQLEELSHDCSYQEQDNRVDTPPIGDLFDGLFD